MIIKKSRTIGVWGCEQTLPDGEMLYACGMSPREALDEMFKLLEWRGLADPEHLVEHNIDVIEQHFFRQVYTGDKHAFETAFNAWLEDQTQEDLIKIITHKHD